MEDGFGQIGQQINLDVRWLLVDEFETAVQSILAGDQCDPRLEEIIRQRKEDWERTQQSGHTENSRHLS